MLLLMMLNVTILIILMVSWPSLRQLIEGTNVRVLGHLFNLQKDVLKDLEQHESIQAQISQVFVKKQLVLFVVSYIFVVVKGDHDYVTYP